MAGRRGRGRGRAPARGRGRGLGRGTERSTSVRTPSQESVGMSHPKSPDTAHGDAAGARVRDHAVDLQA